MLHNEYSLLASYATNSRCIILQNGSKIYVEVNFLSQVIFLFLLFKLHIHYTQKQKKNKNYVRWKINYNIYFHTKSQLAYEQKHIQIYNNAIRKRISGFIYNSLKWALSKKTDYYIAHLQDLNSKQSSQLLIEVIYISV